MLVVRVQHQQHPCRPAHRVSRRRPRARWTSLLALLTLVAGCTSTSPEPPPPPPPDDGAVDDAPPPVAVPVDTVVVLPAASELATRHAAALGVSIDELAAQGSDARDLRAVVPDTSSFVGDLVRTFADRGTPLVCVLGPDGDDVVGPLVERYPATRFCAVPSVPTTEDGDPAPDPVLRADVRVEELGHLAGLAARQHGEGAAVGLSLPGDELQAERFRRAALAGLDGVEVVELRGTAEERAATVEERGITTVLLDGGADNADLVTLLGSSVAVAGPAGVTSAVPLPRRILSWRIGWDIPVGWVVARSARDGGATAATFGLAEDAIEIELGPALPPARAEEVEGARQAIADGARDPLAPAPDPPSAEDDTDDEGPVS